MYNASRDNKKHTVYRDKRWSNAPNTDLFITTYTSTAKVIVLLSKMCYKTPKVYRQNSLSLLSTGNGVESLPEELSHSKQFESIRTHKLVQKRNETIYRYILMSNTRHQLNMVFSFSTLVFLTKRGLIVIKLCPKWYPVGTTQTV